jgi:hypothetical protein
MPDTEVFCASTTAGMPEWRARPSKALKESQTSFFFATSTGRIGGKANKRRRSSSVTTYVAGAAGTGLYARKEKQRANVLHAPAPSQNGGTRPARSCRTQAVLKTIKARARRYHPTSELRKKRHTAHPWTERYIDACASQYKAGRVVAAISTRRKNAALRP